MLRVWGGLIACLLLVAAESFGASPDDLKLRLATALSARALEGARISVLVVNLDNGVVRFSHHREQALIPASNMKILTALAALSTFGPTHRFETELFSDAAPQADGTIGVLGVRGGGDPALTSEQWWRLAADLRWRGIRRIEHGLLLDATRFDSERWHRAWGVVSSRAYNAPIAALNANYGAYGVSVLAGRRAGEPVEASIDPPVRYLRLVERATTVAPRAKAGLVLDRRAVEGAEEVVVSGQVRAASDPEILYRSVLDPVRYAGSVLRMQLEANGIEVAGPTRVAAIGSAMQPLMTFEGQPLSLAVRLFLKYSNNAIGETLVKEMGVHSVASEEPSGDSGATPPAASAPAPGSWSAGVAAMRRELEALGVDLTGVVISDGSGLSYENRVTPVCLVSALRIAERSFRFGAEFQAALPIAAADGTLKRRAGASAAQLRAKTGLLTRVTSLSGYASNTRGERFAFSILVNGFRKDAGSAMDAVDAIAHELTR